MTMQFDPTVLARLTGWSGVVKPAAAAPAKQRIIRAGAAAEGIEVTVVDHAGGDLQVRTADPRIAGLNGRAVVADFRSSTGVLRLQGSLEMLPAVDGTAGSQVAAIRPFVIPDGLQRRASVRVPTNVAVRFRIVGGDGVHWSTTTRDLSAGGAKTATVGDVEAGHRLLLELDLSSGTVTVEGDVLELTDQGTTRIRFRDVPPATAESIERHIAQVPAAHWLGQR